MKIIKLKKKSGGNRTIYVPNHAEKARLRLLVPELTKLAQGICDPDIVHGFMPCKSAVTNAMAHRGFRYSLCCDLKDFFDSVTPEKHFLINDHHPSLLKMPWSCWPEVLSLCFPDGAARQGLPTSPILANIAAVRMDKSIYDWCRVFPSYPPFRYTRYADDLTISSNDVTFLIRLRERLVELVKEHGFTLNTKKTRIQFAGAGRRIITGVAVDDEVHPARAVRRRLRAALHQNQTRAAAGLAEWMKLKTPDPEGSVRISPVKRAVAEATRRRMHKIKHVWEKTK